MTIQPRKPVEITVTHRFDAPPEHVFDAWLDAEHAGEWLFATPGGVMTKVELYGRSGGGFTIIELRGDEDAKHFGTFTTLDRPHRIEFIFSASEDEAGSPVSLAIVPQDEGSELSLTQIMEPEWADYADRVRQSWEMILASLDRVLMR